MNSSKSGIVNKLVTRVSELGTTDINDAVSIEEPVQISVSIPSKGILRKDISITMRTPGRDKELSIGFLFTEDIIRSKSEIIEIKENENQIIVEVTEETEGRIKNLERHFYANSSCGVCGKTSVDQLFPNEISILKPDKKILTNILYNIPAELRKTQTQFDKTGGIHAAAMFSFEGALISFCEDVGRHNALDKLIGTALFNNMLPLSNKLLLLSGRASFELIQKAVRAGIQYIAAIGAPSSLAVDLAIKHELLLVGFLKKDRFNIYSREDLVQYEN